VEVDAVHEPAELGRRVCRQVAAQEAPQPLHRLTGLGEGALGGEDVPKARPHLQRGVHASGAGALHHPPRVVQQELVLSDLRHDGRQSAQIGVERRRQRVPRVRITKVLARLEMNASGVKHGSFPAFVRIDSPVQARSVHGEMHASAAARGKPASRAETARTMVSPPPAESPATTTRAGSAPYSWMSQR
jgi:hypothetical protein